jgi:hypothetical protein
MGVPPCLGCYDLADPECNGGSTTAACDWRDRCHAFERHCAEKDIDAAIEATRLCDVRGQEEFSVLCEGLIGTYGTALDRQAVANTLPRMAAGMAPQVRPARAGHAFSRARRLQHLRLDAMMTHIVMVLHERLSTLFPRPAGKDAKGQIYLIDERVMHDYLALRMRVPSGRGRALRVLFMQRRPLLQGIEARMRIPLRQASELARQIGAPRAWPLDNALESGLLLTTSTDLHRFIQALCANIRELNQEYCYGTDENAPPSKKESAKTQ